MNESIAHENEDGDRLSALLLAWEESVAAGKPLTVAALCVDSPELIPELEREIALLQNLNRLISAPENFSERETIDFSPAGSPRPNSAFAEFELSGFKILEKIGHGGMGVVYKAYQENLRRIVAIKTLAGSRWSQPGLAVRLRREATALSQLNDQHVVKVYDIVETPTSISLILEYVEGGNLATRLNSRPLPPMEAARIAWTVARTMSTVHQQGILHRDIKPANILLGCNGEIKIADFGLAKEEGAEKGQTSVGDFSGTPTYMAPEQAQGRKEKITARTDVYAIGATLYEMLTGRSPFTGTSLPDVLRQLIESDPVAPRLLIPGIPRDLETICLKCLQKEPKERFDSARLLADELERVLQGRPIQSRPTAMHVRFMKWCRRRPALASLVGLSIAATMLIATLIVSNNRSLTKYNQDLVDAAERANELQRLAEESERRAKDRMYASDISRAAIAWKRQDTRELTEFLERHRPGPGEIDRRGFEWWYLYRQANRAKRVLLEAGEPIYKLCYSPDRNWLVTSGKDAIVRFLDPATGKLGKEFPTGQNEVNGVAFSPDGTEFATGGDDGTIRIWNIGTGDERLKITTAFRKVFDLVYTPDQSRIAACGAASPLIRLFDARSGHEVAKWEGHKDYLGGLSLSDDAETLIAECQDNTLGLWNLADGRMTNSIRTPDWESAIYDQKRGLHITGDSSGVLRTFDIKTNHEIESVRQSDGISSLAVHPDGTLLAIGDRGGGIVLRRLDQEGLFSRDLFQPWQAHQSKIYSLVWSTDGSRLISAGKDGRVLSWSLEAAQRAEPRRFVDGQLTSSDLPVESPLALRIERIFRFRNCGNCELSHDEKLYAKVGPPLQLFAISDDLEQPTAMHMLAESSSSLGVLDIFGFTRGAQYLVARQEHKLASGSDDQPNLLLLSVPSLEIVDRLPISGRSLAKISPDGKRLAVAIVHSVILWDIPERKQVWSAPRSGVTQMAFSQDGELFATASADRTIVVHNSVDGEARIQFTNLRSQVHGMRFSPDGRTFVSATWDESLVFYHVATGQELFRLENVHIVYYLEFSESGRSLICRSDRLDGPPEIFVLDASDPEFASEP